MQRTLLATFLFATALPACALSSSDDDTACVGDKCDGTGGGTCPDQRYGDGTCDLDLSCAVPDIDCFRTFDNDEQAAQWFAGFEQQSAMSEGTPPRRVLPTTHPQFAKFRALLDRGWDAFRANRPVGILGNARPALVFVEDPTVNAFAQADADRTHAALAVMVHSGLLARADQSDDAMLGLMMHELQHVVGLHVLPETKSKYTTYYLAPDGKEPIGRMQTDDPQVRAAATAWQTAGEGVGYNTNADLGGLPTGGDFVRVLRTVLQIGMQTNPSVCEQTRTMFAQLESDLHANTDPLSNAITTDASIKTRVDATLAHLQTQCLAGFTPGFVEVVAQLLGTTPEQFEAMLSEEDKAIVLGKHVVEAVRLLGEDRRAKMRAIEAQFQQETGRPWSAVRYFSPEEDADDTSVLVLRGAGFLPTGLGDFFTVLFPTDDVAAQCRAMLASGQVPPYGVDLVDDHHATCWRIYHIDAYAKETQKKHGPERPRVLVEAPARQRMLPPTLKDLVMY